MRQRRAALFFVFWVTSSVVAPAQQDAQTRPVQPRVPPYVVIPDGRPWEAEAFAKVTLRFDVPRAEPSAQRQSYSAGEAGLTRLERGSVLVFHSPGRAKLAGQVADLVEKQHRLLAWYTDQPFQVLPIVVVGAEEEMPQAMGFWVDIDGHTCWKLITEETELPLRLAGHFWADVGRSWLYHGTIHECCHHGTCFRLGLMPHRWFCEGLSDYIAATSAVCYSAELDKAHVAAWIGPVEEILKERQTIDILSTEVWWAPGGGRLQGPVEIAAYAASLYSMARLVDEHGHEWIARVLKRVEGAPGPDEKTLISIIEEETGAKDLAVRMRSVPLKETLAYLRQGIPEDAPAAAPVE